MFFMWDPWLARRRALMILRYISYLKRLSSRGKNECATQLRDLTPRANKNASLRAAPGRLKC